MTKALKILYLLIIFIFSLVWIHDTFSSIKDIIENPPYELTENFMGNEAENSVELFWEESIQFFMLSSIFVILMPLLIFSIKEIELEVTNPPPELFIGIP
ncbi:hypothetical protein [Flavobacterium luteum]|uniref:Uncharacterized protein n=1 Tax=Flavobacterium luteum TaxID=2026654 RepID=A0A7J5ABN9_9FLAO|nr:hypothetical protein [Flavobacterium luteum]KAB1154977.1 hypothetical protein F6464_11170 [Flavobacterium luteum]